MRLRAGLLLLVALIVSAPAPALAQLAAWQQAADDAVRDAVAASEVPGAVLIVGQGDQILHRKVLGWRATVPTPELMTADTIFDIASLTKVVATTPSVLLLWEQGKIDLNAPLGRYVKEFNTPAFQDVTVARLSRSGLVVAWPHQTDDAGNDGPTDYAMPTAEKAGG